MPEFIQNQVMQLLSEYKIQEGGVIVSTKMPDSIHLDSDLGIALWVGEVCLAVSGLSYGLFGYYENWPDELEGLHTGAYSLAVDASKEKWVLTQLQATRGTAVQREKVMYKDMFMSAWSSIMEMLGDCVEFVLPANMNFWMIPEIQEALIASNRGLPRLEGLVSNYDCVAKRNGFDFNEQAQLYQRS